jgi:ubiquinol-cytochrome c reductase subunit 9
MESAARRRSGGVFEGLYKVLMRRNSVYVTFVIAGAFVAERVCNFPFSFSSYSIFVHSDSLIEDLSIFLQAVDYGVHKIWEYNNVGVLNLFISIVILLIFEIMLII